MKWCLKIKYNKKMKTTKKVKDIKFLYTIWKGESVPCLRPDITTCKVQSSSSSTQDYNTNHLELYTHNQNHSNSKLEGMT